MTDQSPTAAFNASSFMDGANADYIDQLAAKRAADSGAVDVESRIKAMKSAGMVVADSPATLGEAVLQAIGK